jgi:multidrug efflux system membrane fusion protein
LENTRVEFNREQKLYDSKVISQDEYDTSKSTYDAAVGTVAADHATVTNAQLNLEFTAIRSPVDGRTGSLQFHKGNVVKAPDDVLVTINQIHPIYVAFSVAERYLPEIQKQSQQHPLAVTATYDNIEGEPPAGELTFIDNAVDTTTGTIQLKATFPNEDGRLWPGQFVQVRLTLSERADALAVPSQAVQIGQGSQFVYVIKADDSVEQRLVKIGFNYGGMTVIESGLKAGETVVTDGQLRLAPGVLVSDKSQSATNTP